MFDEYRAKQRARRDEARADWKRLKGEMAEAVAPVREEWHRSGETARAKTAERTAVREPKPARPEAPTRVGLVAEHAKVRLYVDRIEYGAESRALSGVRARVEEHRTGQEWGGWDQKDIWLTVSGPGFEWPIRTPALVSSRKAREFAAKVNAAGSARG